MKSAWSEYKKEATYLREHGLSIIYIEDKLGVPRSTLSEWFKAVELSPEQRENLAKRKVDALRRHQMVAQAKAAAQRRQQENALLQEANYVAESLISRIDIAKPEVSGLALALIYRGGGHDPSVISAADEPEKLKWVLAALRGGYRVFPADIEYGLRLRPGANDMEARSYWADELGAPIENFTKLVVDKRGRKMRGRTNDMGVCSLICKDVAIQRKLTCLYNLFCRKAISDSTGD